MKQLREVEGSGDFDLGYDRDEKEGEDGWDASSVPGAGLCGFSCGNAFTEVISERSDAILETYHVGPSLPGILIFSTSKVALSPPPFCFPQCSLQYRFIGRVDFLPGKPNQH